MERKNLSIISILVLILAFAGMAQGAFYGQDYNSSDSSTTPLTAHFRIDALKYEPYPVNPGDYFDLWVKVENIGQEDATGSKFELLPA